MVVLSVIQLVLWELLIPLIVGSFFLPKDKKAEKFPLIWVSGQIVLWAVFQILCVPFILRQVDFIHFVRAYAAIVGVMLIGTVALFLKTAGKPKLKILDSGASAKVFIGTGRKTYRELFWVLFGILLLFQLFMAVFMTYADGDDAFYVAISTITENADTMYRKLPYTGGSTDLDARHGLAPFPVWIAFLAKISNVKPVIVAHIAVPLCLIPMTYCIFYLIGSKLTGRENLPVYMVFTALLVLFGDYSFYTMENFMLARSRQGKAAIGSIIIPMIFLVFFMIFGELAETGKTGFKNWLLLGAVEAAGCLCSTQGTFLCCMLTGIFALCGAFTYRRWKIIIPAALCCVPCLVYAALYAIL